MAAHRRRRLLLLVAGALVAAPVLLLLTVPVWTPAVRIPYTRRIDAFGSDLRLLYAAVVEYRSTHDGRNPPSLVLLEEEGLLTVPEGYGRKLYVQIGNQSTCVYNPHAAGDQPMIRCYGITRTPLAMWVTGGGRMFVGRRRLFNLVWPVAELEPCEPDGLDRVTVPVGSVPQAQ